MPVQERMTSRFAVVVLAIAWAAAATYPSGDPDVFFHLAVGRQVAQERGVPETEQLCFPVQGKPFLNHEWLYDLALWGAHQAAGPAGVTIFKASMAALLGGLTTLLALRMGASPFSVLVFGLLFLPLFRSSLEARPHTMAYVMAAATALVSMRLGKKGEAWMLAALAATSAAWANVHGSFPLATAVWFVTGPLAVFVRGKRPSRLLWLGGPVIVAAWMFNPWGPALLGVFLDEPGLAAQSTFRSLVPEWKPVQWGKVPGIDILYLGMTAAALLSFLAPGNRKRMDRLALVLVFLVPAALSSKFMLGLSVGVLPVVQAQLDLRARKVIGWAAAVAAAASLVFLTPGMPPWRGFGLGFDLHGYPDEALDFTKKAGISGRMFNPFNLGGFCEYAAHPRLRTFIDGRAYVHGQERISRYLEALADYGSFKSLDQRWRFDLVLADLQDPSFPRLLQGLSTDPDFSMVWLDSGFAVFVPPRVVAQRRLAPFEHIRPTLDPRYLFDLPQQALPGARSEIARVAGARGGRTLGLLLGGVLALRLAGFTAANPSEALRSDLDRSWCARAATSFHDLVRARPDVGMFRYFLSAALACMGRCDEAKAHAGAAPGFQDAVRLLDLLNGGACTSAERG